MTFIKILIYKLLNKQISNIYSKRFDNYNNTPKGVFWNSKLSQDLRLNIILDKILQNAKSDEFSIADIGCGYGRFYEILKERNLDDKVKYHGFDINQEIINFCKFPGGAAGQFQVLGARESRARLRERPRKASGRPGETGKGRAKPPRARERPGKGIPGKEFLKDVLSFLKVFLPSGNIGPGKGPGKGSRERNF